MKQVKEMSFVEMEQVKGGGTGDDLKTILHDMWDVGSSAAGLGNAICGVDCGIVGGILGTAAGVGIGAADIYHN